MALLACLARKVDAASGVGGQATIFDRDIDDSGKHSERPDDHGGTLAGRQLANPELHFAVTDLAEHSPSPHGFDVHPPRDLDDGVRAGLEVSLRAKPGNAEFTDADSCSSCVDELAGRLANFSRGQEEFGVPLRAEATFVRLRVVRLSVANAVSLAVRGLVRSDRAHRESFRQPAFTL